MAGQANIQAFLRFLSQDAKVPLMVAMSKIKELQSNQLGSCFFSIEALASSNVSTLQPIFSDEKMSKQILAAAKRSNKKRDSAGGSSASQSSPAKRRKTSQSEPLTAAELESSLSLPAIHSDEQDLSTLVLHTNRAPLVLAFAVSLLPYTLPQQPLSSRLSLAQAVVSMNSRSKAVSLGLESGKTAEEQGYGQGQPKVKVMGREITVLKRWAYLETLKDPPDQDPLKQVKQKDPEGADKGDFPQDVSHDASLPALWGLDLEALRTSNGPQPVGASLNAHGLPIYSPQSARAYLLKSFPSASEPDLSQSEKPSPRKPKASALLEEKERNLACLLGALDLLYSSWAPFLSTEELDRRAWSWYVHVRPEVQSGVAGWGGKGRVALADILSLRRKD
ncbi:MAG: hypothetical protein M1817_002974 [Caeruleum heppii]|nr:MAG: hypothetical protein M1817_002974 [Caeruleum heppii]